jgi:hypothetical protein
MTHKSFWDPAATNASNPATRVAPMNKQRRVYAGIYIPQGMQNRCAAIGAWVLYMFYARLSEIALELKKMRVAYEFASARTNSPATSSTPVPDESRNASAR